MAFFDSLDGLSGCLGGFFGGGRGSAGAWRKFGDCLEKCVRVSGRKQIFGIAP